MMTTSADVRSTFNEKREREHRDKSCLNTRNRSTITICWHISINCPYAVRISAMSRITAAISQLGLRGSAVVPTADVPAGAAVVKSLVWTVRGQPVVLVLEQKDIVSVDLLQSHFSGPAKLVSRRQAESLSGFEIGTIPPLAHDTDMRVYICKRFVDRKLTNSDCRIYCGAGEHGIELRVSLQDLLALPHISCQYTFSTSGDQGLRHESDPTPPSCDGIVSEVAQQEKFATKCCNGTEDIPGKVITTQRALHNLVVKEGPEVVDIITYSVRSGAIDPTVVGPAGKYAIHLAAWRGTTAVVDALLESGCDVNTISTGEGNYGKTALFYAITRCRDNMVEHLLSRGAVVSIVNNKGQSIVSLAASHLSHDVQLLLMQHEMMEHSKGVQWQDYFAKNPDERAYGDLDPRFVPLRALSSSVNVATLTPVPLPCDYPGGTSGPTGTRRYRLNFSGYGASVTEFIDMPITLEPSTHDARMKKADKHKAERRVCGIAGVVSSGVNAKKSSKRETSCKYIAGDADVRLGFCGKIINSRLDKYGVVIVKVVPVSTVDEKLFCVPSVYFGSSFEAIAGENALESIVNTFVEVRLSPEATLLETTDTDDEWENKKGSFLVDTTGSIDAALPNESEVWSCDPTALINEKIEIIGVVSTTCAVPTRSSGDLSSLTVRVVVDGLSAKFVGAIDRLFRFGEHESGHVAPALTVPFGEVSSTFAAFVAPLSVDETENAMFRKNSTGELEQDFTELRAVDTGFISETLLSHCIGIGGEQLNFVRRYISSTNDLNVLSNDIKGFIKLCSDCSMNMIVGIDAEWEPEEKGQLNPVSTLQIAFRAGVYIVDMLALCRNYTTTGVHGALHIIDLSPEEALLDSILCSIFSDANTLKIGCAVEGDIKRLKLSFPHMSCFKNIANLLDIQKCGSCVARKLLQQRRTGGDFIGLSDLCAALLNRRLDKSAQRSHWAHRPLATTQLEYAYIDAAVLIVLYDFIGFYYGIMFPN